MALRRRSGSGRGAAAAIADTTPAEAVAAVKARQPLTAKRAKRMIGVGTAVLPLLTPYALAVAGAVRGAWDERKAARLGVDAGQLGTYAGPGGALHARLSRIAEALTQLEGGTGLDSGTQLGPGAVPDSATARAFAADTRPRLADLAVAVRAAEQMPTTRRRTAYRSIGDELDRIEIALLNHLGVVTT